MNYQEAEFKTRQFIMDEKYKLLLAGDANRIEREKFRQKRIYIMKGGGLSPTIVLKAMELQGFEINFKKSVEKLA